MNKKNRIFMMNENFTLAVEALSAIYQDPESRFSQERQSNIKMIADAAILELQQLNTTLPDEQVFGLQRSLYIICLSEVLAAI
jgi:ABC-type Fe3+/spermidine/putrescine transport system ATPase subunit